jgi:CRISPR-associated protein Cas5d
MPKAEVVAHGGPAPVLFADEDRSQRNTVALRNVDYLIEAHFSMTSRAGPEDNPTKFTEMFQRRVEKGQHFHQPYFGCREFIAEVLPADGAPPPVGESRDLGIMLWDIVHAAGASHAVFFRAEVVNGTLQVPSDESAALATLACAKGGVA